MDWSGIRFPWIAPMVECMQDPDYHTEGDVWTHTRMVCALRPDFCLEPGHHGACAHDLLMQGDNWASGNP